MKILAGTYKGRTIVRPKTPSVRPMSDKVRAALFDILGDVSGFTVMDAYAGSGAIGLEAMSRGAKTAIGLEQSPSVAQIIRQNVSGLDLVNSYQLLNLSVEHWLSHSDQAQEFDLIVADPPYDLIQPDILSKLAKRLKSEGLLTVSHSSRIDPPKLQSLGLVQSRTYGDSALSFYKPSLSS